MRLRTTVSGWEVTLVTPVTASQLTMVTSSPRWTGTMTELPSVAPVLQHMAGAGGSTGDISSERDKEDDHLLSSAASRPTLMGNISQWTQTTVTTEELSGSCGWETTR